MIKSLSVRTVRRMPDDGGVSTEIGQTQENDETQTTQTQSKPRFVSRWDPDKLNYCVRAKGRSINRTVGDLNGHPRKIINTKITVRMDTTRRQTETRDTETKTDPARFRNGGEDVRNRSHF